MVQVNTNLLSAVAIVLGLVAPSQATNSLRAREDPLACSGGSLIGKVGQSNGGRKIGIVIDESASMEDNDPSNIRIVAGKALDESLIDKTKAGSGKTADLVTIVGFHTSPDLLYPLGDPAGAVSVIGGISSSKSGTFIGGGIKVATDELSKPGNDPTAKRSGIVVLTDGEDNYSGLDGVEGTINEITRAGGLGIRVSFGFLNVDSSQQDPKILNAILKTGGAFTSFTSAVSQQNFIAQVLAQGLTEIDVSSNTTALLPGLVTSALLSQSAPNTFGYSAKSGESVNFTITAIDQLSLKATLKDAKAGTELATGETNTAGIATILYSAKADGDLELVVTATGTSTSGIFSVGLESSLGVCSNTTTPTNNLTTPTSTPPAQYTGGSSQIGSVSGVVVGLFGLVMAALML